ATVRTADDGTFVEEGLTAGDYLVTIQPGSVPAGYPVADLAPQRVRVDQNAPGRARFVLRPYRSVSGRARVFNRDTGEYATLAAATVEILPLGAQSVTDADGRYTFRNLAAGEYTVVTRRDGREHSVLVRVPEGPALVKDVDLAVLPGPGVIASAASTEPEAHVERPVSETFTIEVAASTNAKYAKAMVDELKF